MSVTYTRSLLCVGVVAFAAMSCKETNETSATMPGSEEEAVEQDYIEAQHKERPEFYASDAAYIQKNSNFFYRIWDETFTRKLDDLPLTGEVSAERRPKSGGYYAENTGGIDVVMTDGKSPLKKFDEAFNNGSPNAVNWERSKHAGGPAWAGHCNGFAAAAQRHPKEPFKSVKRGTVTFSPQDIKALLAEIYMNADYEFLGGNRCEKERNAFVRPDGRVDKTKMDECEDINPGTLHVAMANWIGKAKHTLIMDLNSDLEVWNYPLYKYASTKTEVNKTQARNYISGVGSEYIFNPAATRFAYVQTTLTYANAEPAEVLGQLNPREMKLTYILELNAAGEILGGEWVGDISLKNHPDFLWVALEPLEPNGTRYMGNPHIKSDEVIKLWAESAGYTPENAPKGIRRPSGLEDWGRWPGFEVSLDGNTRGAVFAGKDTQLVIKRKEGLLGPDYNLEILLNGLPLKSIDTGNDEQIKVALQPGLGLHRFQFVWKKDNSVIEDEYLRFHVVR